ncbi:MAG: hypothetical protein AAB091_02095 [Elusimicrobiota bacterium]|mgnify:CR=1 FL=1
MLKGRKDRPRNERGLALFFTAIFYFTLAPAVFASESFQFSPPPFSMLNQRGVDAQRDGSIDYIGMKIGNADFKAANFGFNRTAKQWDTGGMGFGFNYMLITASMKDNSFGSASINFFGMGLSPNFNFIFDVFGREEDDFSLPIYFGPHVNYNNIMGSAKVGSSNMSISILYLSYGAQFGVQAGVNLGPLKLVPYVDFSKEMGGTIVTSVSPCVGSGCSTTASLGSMPVAMSPGFDVVIRPIGVSLGAMTQSLKKPNSNSETKTTVFHLRFKKKFRSICGM